MTTETAEWPCLECGKPVVIRLPAHPWLSLEVPPGNEHWSALIVKSELGVLHNECAENRRRWLAEVDAYMEQRS